MERCDWANASALEVEYHDKEWGVPVYEDRLLFELLILEGAQAGLSWSTILRKRQGYQEAFAFFDAAKIVQFSAEKRASLLKNSAIVRNRLKINSVFINAQCFLEVQEEYGSFCKYIWSFVGGVPIQNKWRSGAEVPVVSRESEQMSKSLKKRGFRFVGPTICYAYMQAVGMVNDHLVSCFRHQQLQN